MMHFHYFQSGGVISLSQSLSQVLGGKGKLSLSNSLSTHKHTHARATLGVLKQISGAEYESITRGIKINQMPKLQFNCYFCLFFVRVCCLYQSPPFHHGLPACENAFVTYKDKLSFQGFQHIHLFVEGRHILNTVRHILIFCF